MVCSAPEITTVSNPKRNPASEATMALLNRKKCFMSDGGSGKIKIIIFNSVVVFVSELELGQTCGHLVVLWPFKTYYLRVKPIEAW